MVISGAIAWRVLLHSTDGALANKQTKTDPIGLHEALRSSVFRASVMTNFSLGWISYGMRASLMPLFLLNVLNEGPEWIGISLAIGSLAQVVVLPASGKFTDKEGRRVPMIIGNLMLVVSLISLVVWPSLLSYIICLVGLGVATAFCSTSSSAAIGDVTRGRGGTVIAVYQMGADLGMVVGPLIAGVIADSHSFSAGISTSAIIGLLAFILALQMSGRRAEE